MKSITKLILGGVFLTLLIVGCATKNPQAGQVSTQLDPTTGVSTTYTNPPYIPNVTATKIIGVASTVNDASAPVNPWAPIIASVLGLATLVTGTFAKVKNDQAKTAQAQTAVMAQGIVKAGPAAVSVVQDVAASTPHYSAIANHLNEATP